MSNNLAIPVPATDRADVLRGARLSRRRGRALGRRVGRTRDRPVKLARGRYPARRLKPVPPRIERQRCARAYPVHPYAAFRVADDQALHDITKIKPTSLARLSARICATAAGTAASNACSRCSSPSRRASRARLQHQDECSSRRATGACAARGLRSMMPPWITAACGSFPGSHATGVLHPFKEHDKPDEFDVSPESYGFR